MSLENRLKFLCSYGGMIFPCPSDGHLKYVGGHTRVLSVARSVSFSELKRRIEGMIDCSLAAIKYELEVDGIEGALVSIGCDEDLAHMIDEYDRLEVALPTSSARFRLFLFPLGSASPTSKAAAAAAAFSCTSPSSSSTIDGAVALGPNGHCVCSTPNPKGRAFTRQLSLAAARAAPQHQQQNHLLSRQRSMGALSHASRAVPAGAFGCGSRVVQPQSASRGDRFPHGGGGGCVSHWPASRPKNDVFW